MPDQLSIFQGEDGDWHWHRKAPNGEVISRGEGYTRRDDAVRGARRANPGLALQVREMPEPLGDEG